MTAPDVLVMREKVHGRSTSEYAKILDERLPDHEVAFAETPAEEHELLAQAPVVTGLYLDEEQVAGAENMELFACVFAGTGHLPMETLEQRGVAVTNASGVHGPNIGEYVVCSLTMCLRKFKTAWRQQDRREWASYEVGELYDSTVCIVGLGAIGQAVAARLEPFGVDTVGVRYTPEKGGPTDEVYGFEKFDRAVAEADHLVLACPLTETTRGLVDAETFTLLDGDSVLVNVARGPIVDTEALVGAMRSNDIGAAVLDVTDPEPLPPDHVLWRFEDVHITPHNAGNTPQYFERVADILVDNLEHVAETGGYEGIRNRVV